ncbi:hypothetical protein [Pseudomonas sp. NBRC 111124]|uniref:hypothetical protein n=1 Tax=Pseudomonas sp. NBRC 111124 TaxID=1661039 RepID=UPI0007612323|nr:hypothetical protein [Pseudomonas sp. NBRC 111124]
MIISFSPVRMEERLTLEVDGDVVVINGAPFDFTPLPEGATLPREAILSDWFPGDVERVDGELSLTVRLPHGANAPEATRFPSQATVIANGIVDLPAYDVELKAEPEVQQ